MLIITHKPRSKWHSPTFTLRQVGREELSIILNLAQEALALPENAGLYPDIQRTVRALDAHINHPDLEVRNSKLEI